MTRAVNTTEEELRHVVEAATRGVLRDIGIIAHDDEAVDERRRDFQFLNDLRKSSEGVKARVGAFFLLSAAGGLVTLIVLGLKAWSQQP
jgi:hypothetical protein